MHDMPDYQFETRDGIQVRVYPVGQRDAGYLHDLMERATPQNRLAASLGQTSASSDVLVSTALDGNAWAAIVVDEQIDAVPAAVAWFSQTHDDQAEVIVVVRDDMQGRGIGSRMLYFVLDQARAAGMRTAVTSFESSNEAAWQVLQYSPYHITWQPRGRQVDAVIHLQARASAGTTMN